MLTDTHCHLDACKDPQAEMLAAQAAGIARIVVPAVERAGFAAISALCASNPVLFPAYGIHPMFVDDATEDDLLVLRGYLGEHNTVAAGEIGLDFYIEKYDQEKQEYFFTEQLKIARELNLPVLLHTRRALDTVIKHLRNNPVCGGISHAFSGSRQQADELIELGFKFGFGGAMTYPRATRIRELAASLPLNSIVLETDAPDMAPEFSPRGQPNRPEYLLRIAQTLANLRGVSLEEIARATRENAHSVLSRLPHLRN